MLRYLLLLITFQAFAAQAPPLTITFDQGHEDEWRKKEAERLILPSLIGKDTSSKKIDYEFLKAVYFKDLPKTKEYLSAGANINACPRGHTALHIALLPGRPHYELIFFLLDRSGINVNIRTVSGFSPFNFACEHLAHSYTPDQKVSCYQLFKKLLERDAHISKHDMDNIKWPLMLRQGFEHKEIRALIEFAYEYKQQFRPQAVELKMMINIDA